MKINITLIYMAKKETFNIEDLVINEIIYKMKKIYYIQNSEFFRAKKIFFKFKLIFIF